MPKQRPDPLNDYLYSEMYAARNDFLHGNRITKRSLVEKVRKSGTPLYQLGPVMYRFLLYAFLLENFRPRNMIKPSSPEERLALGLQNLTFEDAVDV